MSMSTILLGLIIFLVALATVIGFLALIGEAAMAVAHQVERMRWRAEMDRRIDALWTQDRRL